MSGRRVRVDSPAAVPLETMLKEGVRGERPDVGALAALDAGAKTLAVMVWHYHDDDLPGPDAAVELKVGGLPGDAGGAKVQHFRIDQTHSNAYAAWKATGSPQSPTAEQYAELERAGQLQRIDGANALSVEGKDATIGFNLPRQGVSLLVLAW